MKKLIFITLLLFSLFTAGAKPKAPVLPTVQETFKSDKINKQTGYQFIDGGSSLVFVFSPSAYKIARPLNVYVQGSFNSWVKKDPDWELSKKSSTLWTLTVKTEDIMIPGNSGYPEFKYYVIGEVEYTETVCGKELIRYKKQTFEPNAISRIPGYKMGNNNLILRPEDNPEESAENSLMSEKLRKLSDFDLENPESVAELTNVRLVPGTTKLYRGYHPYKVSRPHFDTEETRIRLVNKALKDYGVQSLITLSGNESVNPSNEQISVYVSNIREAGNQHFVDTNYYTVYYNSASREFGKIVAGIVEFINSHPGPYYIHCRLGTDRTGVMSAVLAALSGADWASIKEDYQKTNRMGIKEFRDWKLLKYSFDNILGEPVEEVADLEKAMSDYFTSNGFLKPSQLQELKNRLK